MWNILWWNWDKRQQFAFQKDFRKLYVVMKAFYFYRLFHNNNIKLSLGALSWLWKRIILYMSVYLEITFLHIMLLGNSIKANIKEQSGEELPSVYYEWWSEESEITHKTGYWKINIRIRKVLDVMIHTANPKFISPKGKVLPGSRLFRIINLSLKNVGKHAKP